MRFFEPHTHHPAESCDDCADWPLWWRDLATRSYEIKEIQMNQQDQIDAITTTLTSVKTKVDALVQEVATLTAAQAAGEDLNLNGLQSATDALSADFAPAAGDGTPTGGGDAPTTPVAATLYANAAPGSPVDTTVWVLADVTEPDGTPLYTFAQDVDGSALGAGGPWVVYSGPTIPVVVPASS